MKTPERERLESIENLMDAITALEAQRAVLGDVVVDTALAPLRRQLAELEQAESEPAAPAFAGERKLVTVMFADIVGFTALAERIDPEAVRDLTNACFDRLVPLIEKYGGTVDKFIGDEIMALFGAPVAHENDPERALRAALEMREALAGFNAEHGTDLGIHFGINTGLVVAGGLGSKGREQYSVMGDAVNVAARLEEISQRNEILVGPDTYRLAPLFRFEDLEPVRVKGKTEPMTIYRLLMPRVAPDPRRSIAGLTSPLVGRQAEFRALQQAIQDLQAGVGGVVTLVGEAGLGKSRLMAEVHQQTPVGDASRWVEGRCLSHGTSIAYLLWLDVLRELLHVTPEDSPAVVRDRVQELCPERFDDVYPYLSRLMPLSPRTTGEADALVRDLGGESLRAGTFQAVEVLVERLAQRYPLIVVCEDLHWADSTSIALLERLLALTDRVPLLFICVFRPEREHGCWHLKEIVAPRHRHVDLELEPLSAAEGEALVGNLLRARTLPSQLRTHILGRAEGNPLYMEEIVRALIDSGAIAQDERTGRWQATRDMADVAIPDTLHGVIMARIDRLQEETKRTLQLAAVIGRIFLYRVLATIAATVSVSWKGRELDEHLLILQREEMIRERAQVPELEYIFKHHLTREAAYNGLLRKDRRTFHRQVAEALERLFPDRVEEQLGLLAYHWERAEELEKATAYLLRAGDQARLTYAHQEAVDYYQRALVFLKERGTHEQVARTLMKLGLVYHNAFDFEAARQSYEEGFGFWQRMGSAPPKSADLLPLAPHALRVTVAEPSTLDPCLVRDIPSVIVTEQLFSGLIERSPAMGVVPNVAHSWDVLEGGKYVFHLRDDVLWSDGVPVTAGDFEYAWKRVLAASPQPIPYFLYDIQGARAYHQGEVPDPQQVGVHALDDLTLAVELEGPTGYFPQLLTYFPAFPVPRHAVQAHGAAWAEVENIVTNGPFRLVAWKRGVSIVLERNPTYHGRFTGNLRRVECTLLSGQPARELALYNDNRLDVLFALPPPEMERARHRHAGEYVLGPRLSTAFVGFDVARTPFDDSRVRRALTLATDRETLANVILRGYAFPATGGLVPPGMPGYSPGIGLPHDYEAARRLLTEAGYPEGRGFPVIDCLARDDPGLDLLCEYLQKQWQENLGIEITWQQMARGKFVDRLFEETPRMWMAEYLMDYPDPDNPLRCVLSLFNPGWQDQAYTGLVEGARRAMDQGARMGMYGQADRILMEAAPILPLFYGRFHLLVKPWVAKYPISAIKTWFWKDVIVEPH